MPIDYSKFDKIVDSSDSEGEELYNTPKNYTKYTSDYHNKVKVTEFNTPQTIRIGNSNNSKSVINNISHSSSNNNKKPLANSNDKLINNHGNKITSDIYQNTKYKEVLWTQNKTTINIYIATEEKPITFTLNPFTKEVVFKSIKLTFSENIAFPLDLNKYNSLLEKNDRRIDLTEDYEFVNLHDNKYLHFSLHKGLIEYEAGGVGHGLNWDRLWVHQSGPDGIIKL